MAVQTEEREHGLGEGAASVQTERFRRYRPAPAGTRRFVRKLANRGDSRCGKRLDWTKRDRGENTGVTRLTY